MKTIVVIFSANSEWRAVCAYYSQYPLSATPFGETFECELAGQRVVMLQGGWGKISAAASAQYAILRWNPDWVFNLGTCGGFSGHVQRGEVLLVEKTIVYDIFEQMGDAQQALQFYSCNLDVSVFKEPYPQTVRRGLLVSADRDIFPADMAGLIEKYGASAADWESGSIAWVCQRNHKPCLILRAVSDLVSEQGGEAYNNIEIFHQSTQVVMQPLLQALPAWIACTQTNP